MSVNASELSFEKAATLWDVEQLLKELESLRNKNVQKISVKLPRRHKMKFFKDSWISSFIATASSHGAELTITDWHHSDDHTDVVRRFSNSLIGITSAFMANEISNTQHRKFNIDIDEIIEQIIYKRDGLIEDNESGKSFVFCSFDSADVKQNFPKPLALSADTKEEFVEKFIDIKRKMIDADPGASSSSTQLSFIHEFDRELARLIYELYENTGQHGKYDENNKIIRGVRSFSLKRHTSHALDNFLDQAQQFDELEMYLKASHPNRRNPRYYEIAISDNGLGILERFTSTRPDISESERFSSLDKVQQLNHIISQNLSSKLYPGSGLGLSLALDNLRSLKGFMSLRTSNLWVCFNGADNDGSVPLQLTRVKNSEKISEMSGTHYNIVIPLS